mgnify:CR=1 FL=1
MKLSTCASKLSPEELCETVLSAVVFNLNKYATNCEISINGVTKDDFSQELIIKLIQSDEEVQESKLKSIIFNKARTLVRNEIARSSTKNFSLDTVANKRSTSSNLSDDELYELALKEIENGNASEEEICMFMAIVESYKKAEIINECKIDSNDYRRVRDRVSRKLIELKPKITKWIA